MARMWQGGAAQANPPWTPPQAGTAKQSAV